MCHAGWFSAGATPIQHVRDARRILADAGRVIVNEALSGIESNDSSDDEPQSEHADGWHHDQRATWPLTRGAPGVLAQQIRDARPRAYHDACAPYPTREKDARARRAAICWPSEQ